MRTITVLIHGVNHFNEDDVKRQFATTYGVSENEIVAFNWDKLIPCPFPRAFPWSFRPRPMAEIGHAFLVAAHLGFLAHTKEYEGIRNFRLVLHNVLAM